MADSKAKRRFFEVPVSPDPPFDISALPKVRAGHFPRDAGPRPWLDRPDAARRIEQRLKAGEITAAQAELCRNWSQYGYLILDEFFSANQLDLAWAAYDLALADGRIEAPPEKRHFSSRKSTRFCTTAGCAN
jgi:hypothetical protein